jgi:Rrf2 family protein
LISKTGLHSIRALTLLAELPAGRCAGAASVARRIGAPGNYLGKLLQALTREGLVESQKGMGGGFRLARGAAEITLLDVVRTTDPVERLPQCFLGRPSCSEDDPCAVHQRWASLRDAYLDLLAKTTLADLARHGSFVESLAGSGPSVPLPLTAKKQKT